MKVIRGWSTHPERSLVDPLLERSGLMLEFRGGNYMHPRGEGDWFKHPYFPDGVTRFFWPLWGTYALAAFGVLLVLAGCALVGPVALVALFLLPLNPGIFISYRIGKKGGYLGAKAYGADSPAYANWMGADNVYEGSQALMYSIRPFATMRD